MKHPSRSGVRRREQEKSSPRGRPHFAPPSRYGKNRAGCSGSRFYRAAGRVAKNYVSHGRYVTFQMAEVAVSRQMFQEILSLIARLRAPPAPA